MTQLFRANLALSGFLVANEKGKLMLIFNMAVHCGMWHSVIKHLNNCYDKVFLCVLFSAVLRKLKVSGWGFSLYSYFKNLLKNAAWKHSCGLHNHCILYFERCDVEIAQLLFEAMYCTEHPSSLFVLLVLTCLLVLLLLGIPFAFTECSYMFWRSTMYSASVALFIWCMNKNTTNRSLLCVFIPFLK